MGKNSPSMHSLQVSLKTWVNFTQDINYGALNIHVPFFKLFKNCFSQTYIIFCKHNGKKVVDKVMKFPFCNTNNKYDEDGCAVLHAQAVSLALACDSA